MHELVIRPDWAQQIGQLRERLTENTGDDQKPLTQPPREPDCTERIATGETQLTVLHFDVAPACTR